LIGASGKLTVSINKPIVSEEDEMGSTLDKEELTRLKGGLVAKRSVLPQRIIVEQMD
jgi:hypothetical protein